MQAPLWTPTEPTRWIVASGWVEKERDGPVRSSGFNERFLVLSPACLFWFRRGKDSDGSLLVQSAKLGQILPKR